MTLVRNVPGGPAVDVPVERQRDLGGSADVEVVADDALEEGPTGRRSVEHSGIGDLELAKREFVAVPGAQVGRGEG
jgi:hypothetical protein